MSQLMLYFPFSDPALLWEMWRGSVLAAGTVLVVLLVFKFGILRLLQSLRGIQQDLGLVRVHAGPEGDLFHS